MSLGVAKRTASWSTGATAQHSPRVYDHRIREQVVRTGDPDLFPQLEIPRKTALSWIRRGTRDVVTLDEPGWETAHHVRLAKLERRVAMLSALLRLVLTLLRISGFELERTRVPTAADKRRMLTAIERARKVMPLSAALRVLRLSSSRYNAWVAASDACTLDDRPSCPRSKVQRLTFNEVHAMGDMVQSTQHRHMSIRRSRIMRFKARHPMRSTSAAAIMYLTSSPHDVTRRGNSASRATAPPSAPLVHAPHRHATERLLRDVALLDAVASRQLHNVRRRSCATMRTPTSNGPTWIHFHRQRRLHSLSRRAGIASAGAVSWLALGTPDRIGASWNPSSMRYQLTWSWVRQHPGRQTAMSHTFPMK